MNRVLSFLGKMNTAIGLLLLAAVLSMSGTFIQQNLPPDFYLSQYGMFWGKVIVFSGLSDVYRAWWFLGTLLVLLFSVGTCVMRSGRRIFRQFGMPKQVPLENWRRSAVLFDAKLVKKLKCGRAHTVGGKTCYVKGRLNRLGYFFVHVGVLGIALGGLLTGLVGYRAVLNIRDGETDYIALVFRGEKVIPKFLPFEVTNQTFVMDHYAMGMPKQYRTELSFKGADGAVVRRTIEVNKPVRYDRYTFYQAAFGDGGSKVNLTLSHFGKNAAPQQVDAFVYKTVRFDDYTIELFDYRVHTVFAGRDLGPSLDYILRGPDIQPLRLQVYQNYPELVGVEVGQNEEGDVQFFPTPLTMAREKADIPVFVQLNSAEQLQYSGLQVVYDPGKYVFWPSSLLFSLGVVLMVSVTYIQVWVFGKKAYLKSNRGMVFDQRYVKHLINS